MSNKEKWQDGWRTVLTCLKCDSRIFSERIGQYVECNCSSTFIDETPYYCRIGGETEFREESYEKLFERDSE